VESTVYSVHLFLIVTPSEYRTKISGGVELIHSVDLPFTYSIINNLTGENKFHIF